MHIGYRKGAKGGEWLVRWYIGNGNYHRAAVGSADDYISAGTLSYDQACKQARQLVAERRGQAGRCAEGPRETVGQAVEQYVAMRDERLAQQRPGTRQRSDAASRLTKHVLDDEIAKLELAELSEDVLGKWKERAALDCSAGSRVRTINDFKAALNLVHRRLRRHLPSDFAETVRWGLSTDKMLPVGYKKARENQILEDDAIRAIVAAAAPFDSDGDVGRMVLLLAATGARFSQLQRLTVGDVQADRQRIFIPLSRKGQGRVDAHYPIRVGDDVIEALRPVLHCRSHKEPLLCRWRMKQVKRTESRGLIWVRDYRGPWTSAAEITRQWQAICESVGLKGTIPYALRHSSIVRAIRAGLPIRLVAAMHDTSVAMIERHYARYIVDGLEELTAKAIVPLVCGPQRKAA
jgi:integrase